MRKLVVAFLLCLTSSIANAQSQSEFQHVPKSVLCGPLNVLFTALAHKDIDEKPFWVGKDEAERTDYAVFINTKTGAFTILQFGREMGCILGIGYKSETFKLPLGNPS